MNNKGAEQTARMRRLICAFVVRIWHKQVLLMTWPKKEWVINCWEYTQKIIMRPRSFNTSEKVFYFRCKLGQNGDSEKKKWCSCMQGASNPIASLTAGNNRIHNSCKGQTGKKSYVESSPWWTKSMNEFLTSCLGNSVGKDGIHCIAKWHRRICVGSNMHGLLFVPYSCTISLTC